MVAWYVKNDSASNKLIDFNGRLLKCSIYKPFCMALVRHLQTAWWRDPYMNIKYTFFFRHDMCHRNEWSGLGVTLHLIVDNASSSNLLPGEYFSCHQTRKTFQSFVFIHFINIRIRYKDFPQWKCQFSMRISPLRYYDEEPAWEKGGGFEKYPAQALY